MSKKSRQSHAVMRLIWRELQLVGALWPCHVLLRHASKQHITRRMRIYQICQIYQSQMQSAICSGPDLGCDLEWVEWTTPQKACFSGLGCEMSVWVLEITAVMCHCLPVMRMIIGVLECPQQWLFVGPLFRRSNHLKGTMQREP